MKVIFAGTPDIAAQHLNVLLHSSHEVVAVYTQPDRPAGRGQKLTASPVKELALQHNLPIFQPISLKDSAVQDQLKAFNADIMVVVAYGLLLPQAVLDIPRSGCINVHVSLLPRWRGAAPVQHAILAGDTQSGVTIMQMDKGLDTGDILKQVVCDIAPTETTQSLYEKILHLGPDALLVTLDKIDKQEIQPVKQDDALVTYAHKIQKADAEINWQETADVIDRKIRGYNPWPVAYSYFNDQLIRIWQAKIVSAKPAAPGEILEITKDRLMVACGGQALSLETLQLPGGKPLAIREILQANKPGFVLGAAFHGASKQS